VIRGLALGTLNEQTRGQFLNREFKMAVSLSTILSFAGFLRAAAFRTPLPETLAVTASLTLIVFTSVCLGAVLPLLLQKLGVDPAHSSTTIQVVMDILGVFFAVAISSQILDSPLGMMLINKLGG
jgi:Mg/Co/Ni transporter MgtE